MSERFEDSIGYGVLQKIFSVYMAKRLVYAFISLWAISTIVFLITNLLPGSVADIVLGTTATPERVAMLEQRLGLNRPLHIRYYDWITGIPTGNWGQSLVGGQPVTELVYPRFVRSIQLALISISMVIIVSIPLGVFTAAKQDTILDYLISGITYVGVSTPSFVSATFILLIFTDAPLDFFPSGGYVPLSNGVIPWLHHLILPSFALTFFLTAYVLRQTRASVIEALQADYVRTARLKGVSDFRILFKHALRNALLPTITVLAINFGWTIGSLVIIEEIFTYPGLGRMIVQAIESRDIPLIQMGVIIASGGYIFANLFADIAYSLMDPRVDFGDN